MKRRLTHKENQAFRELAVKAADPLNARALRELGEDSFRTAQTYDDHVNRGASPAVLEFFEGTMHELARDM
jgi:hypothetical protein